MIIVFRFELIIILQPAIAQANQVFGFYRVLEYKLGKISHYAPSEF